MSTTHQSYHNQRLSVPPPLQLVKLSPQHVPGTGMSGGGPSAKNSQRVPSSPNGGSSSSGQGGAGSSQGKRPNSLAVKQLNYHNQHSFNHQTPKSLNVQPSFGQYDEGNQQEGGQAPPEGSYDPKRYQTAAPRPPLMNQSHKGHHLQHQSHSLGRDLQGMGLITQVKKGEKVPSALPSGIPLRPTNHSKQQESYVDQGGRLPLFDLMDEDAPLLAPQKSDVKGRKTLVLDLDETLVHSSFKPPTGIEPPADIVLPVDIEGRVCNVYVVVRPGCIKFLTEMAKCYEVVIFTASLSKYADPLMDIIDQKMVAPQRLFREHCTFSDELGVFVKDMSRLGRDMRDCLIIDNSPLSFAFQPENGMPILSWYDDRTDTKLIELIPVLKLLSEVPDVRPVLTACCSRDNVYLTDKSINMCQRIIDDMNRRQNQRESPIRSVPSASFKSPGATDQGKFEDEEETSPTATLHPPNFTDSNPYYRDELKKSSPKSHQRGQRNQNQEFSAAGSSSSHTSPVVQSMHKQYMSLTNSKPQNIIRNGTFVSGNASNQGKMFSKVNNSATQDEKDKQQHVSDHTTMQMADVSLNDEDYTIKRSKSKKKATFSTVSSSALGKKRPKTASREASLTKNAPPSRQKLQSQFDASKSPGMPLKISLTQQSVGLDQSFRKSGGGVFASTLTTPIALTSKISPSQTPNILQNKLRTSYQVVPSGNQRESKKKIFVLNSGSARVMTTKNSTRNSVERQSATTQNVMSQLQDSVSMSLNTTQKSKSRAGSARKKATTFSEKELAMIGSPQTPSATKNLSKIGNSQKYQSVRTNTSQQARQQPSIETETPPTKIGSGSLMSRILAASTASGTPMSKQYSTLKKTAAKPSGSVSSLTKRLISKSPASRDNKPAEGRTPGGIFGQTGSSAGYANLMKNLSPTFKSMHTPQATSKLNTTGQTPKSALNNSAVIKGVKMMSNQVAHGGYLANKFESTVGGHEGTRGASNAYNNVLALEIAQTQASTSSKCAGNNSIHYDKTCEISSILNEFERTKNLNKELLLMRNIGSPKQPSTHGSLNKQQHN